MDGHPLVLAGIAIIAAHVIEGMLVMLVSRVR